MQLRSLPAVCFRVHFFYDYLNNYFHNELELNESTFGVLEALTYFYKHQTTPIMSNTYFISTHTAIIEIMQPKKATVENKLRKTPYATQSAHSTSEEKSGKSERSNRCHISYLLFTVERIALFYCEYRFFE